MISAIIFDLDGTLIETEELKALSYARAAAELRPGVVEDEVISAYSEDLVGHSRQEVATGLVQRFGLEAAARERQEPGEEPWQVLVRVRNEIYEDLLGDSDLLLEKRYPHNIELLRELRGEGYPVACATMSHRYQVDNMLEVLGVSGEFEVVATMDDVGRGKPDPEIDLLVAGKMGFPPEEFLVIEDSPAGVEAALAAGMSVVAVPTSITGNKLRSSGLLEPHWMVWEPDELSGVVHERVEDLGGARAG